VILRECSYGGDSSTGTATETVVPQPGVPRSSTEPRNGHTRSIIPSSRRYFGLTIASASIPLPLSEISKTRRTSFLCIVTCLLWSSAVTRLAVLTEQKLHEEIGVKKQHKAYQVPLDVPPSYVELIQNRVSSGKVVPRDRIGLSTPAFSGHQQNEQIQQLVRKRRCKQ
jgi:hypothetical protein